MRGSNGSIGTSSTRGATGSSNARRCRSAWHRWVRPVGRPHPVRVADKPIPRAELLEWADGLADLPIDPVHGPAWHVVVQPLTDGCTAVSMLWSHMIGDGVGALLAIFEAVTGNTRNFGYEQPGSAPGGRPWSRTSVRRSGICRTRPALQ